MSERIQVLKKMRFDYPRERLGSDWREEKTKARKGMMGEKRVYNKRKIGCELGKNIIKLCIVKQSLNTGQKLIIIENWLF